MGLHRSLLMLLRLGAAAQLVSGIGLWTGHLQSLMDLHRTIGVLFVVSLWIIAVIAMAQQRDFGLAAFALIWGVVVATLGFTQQHILPGDLHWIVRVLHAAAGIASMPIAERLVPRPMTAPA